MVSVKDCIVFAPDRFESKVSQVCLGLIKGLAYLHERRIAHRDIKPDNLLVDQNSCLKMIDFDLAMWVEDEDEEVHDQRRTENWMAPEVKKNLRHSPIMADRWACGRVLLFLLDKFGEEDESLRVFARNLTSWRVIPSSGHRCLDGVVSQYHRSRTLEPYGIPTQERPSDLDGTQWKPTEKTRSF